MKTQDSSNEYSIRICIANMQDEIDRMKDQLNVLTDAKTESQNHIQKKFLTEIETQTLLQKKSTSLWKLRKEGKLIVKTIGKTNYYSVESINQLLESGN